MPDKTCQKNASLGDNLLRRREKLRRLQELRCAQDIPAASISRACDLQNLSAFAGETICVLRVRSGYSPSTRRSSRPTSSISDAAGGRLAAQGPSCRG